MTRDRQASGHRRALWQSHPMRAADTSVEDLEEFWERLQGPLGNALRMAGAIIKQRLDARGLELSDLSDDEMIDLLYSAFREARPAAISTSIVRRWKRRSTRWAKPWPRRGSIWLGMPRRQAR